MITVHGRRAESSSRSDTPRAAPSVGSVPEPKLPDRRNNRPVFQRTHRSRRQQRGKQHVVPRRHHRNVKDRLVQAPRQRKPSPPRPQNNNPPTRLCDRRRHARHNNVSCSSSQPHPCHPSNISTSRQHLHTRTPTLSYVVVPCHLAIPSKDVWGVVLLVLCDEWEGLVLRRKEWERVTANASHHAHAINTPSTNNPLVTLNVHLYRHQQCAPPLII